MKLESIAVLDNLIRETPEKENIKRKKRSIILLKDPVEETSGEWFMYVPTSFNDALDIKLTERGKAHDKSLVWTQGSAFSFKAGHTLYDNPKAYKIWSDALDSINLSIQITTASAATSSQKDKARSPGSVMFSILTPSIDRSTLVERATETMTQDEFIRFLIAGPNNQLKDKIERAME